jgi:hypothetical protein
MRSIRTHFSLRHAIALFLAVSISLGVLLDRHTKHYEVALIHWPSLETYTEHRTFFFEREVAYSVKDQTGRAVSNVNPNDLFKTFGTSSNPFT